MLMFESKFSTTSSISILIHKHFSTCGSVMKNEVVKVHMNDNLLSYVEH
jgi:hypothetical protein